MVEYLARGKRLVALAALTSLGFAGLAHAQTTVAGANAGYSRVLNQALSTSDAVRDANGQPVAADGVTQAGEDQSGFTHDGADGSLDIASGVGAVGAGTAFGNDLNVVTSGPAAGAQTTSQTTSTTVSSAGVNQAQGGGVNQ